VTTYQTGVATGASWGRAKTYDQGDRLMVVGVPPGAVCAASDEVGHALSFFRLHRPPVGPASGLMTT